MYYLGIDGGGTKTEFLLADGELNEIKRIKKAASNPVSVGIETTLTVLGEGLSEIACDIPCGNLAVFAGIAGILRGDFVEKVKEFLGKYGFSAFDAGTDCLNAYKAAFPEDDGVCVIMGTGTSVFYKSEGKLKILGGLGYLFDRYGSGYDIGAAGLRSALLFEQGAGPRTLIRDKILEKEEKNALLPELMSYYSCEREKIASFSECVFDACDKGDKIAENIVRENIRRVAEIIGFALADIKEKNTKVALTGGLSKNKTISGLMREFLPEGTNVFVSERDNAAGAVLLAIETTERL